MVERTLSALSARLWFCASLSALAARRTCARIIRALAPLRFSFCAPRRTLLPPLHPLPATTHLGDTLRHLASRTPASHAGRTLPLSYHAHCASFGAAHLRILRTLAAHPLFALRFHSHAAFPSLHAGSGQTTGTLQHGTAPLWVIAFCGTAPLFLFPLPPPSRCVLHTIFASAPPHIFYSARICALVETLAPRAGLCACTLGRLDTCTSLQQTLWNSPPHGVPAHGAKRSFMHSSPLFSCLCASAFARTPACIFAPLSAPPLRIIKAGTISFLSGDFHAHCARAGACALRISRNSARAPSSTRAAWRKKHRRTRTPHAHISKTHSIIAYHNAMACADAYQHKRHGNAAPQHRHIARGNISHNHSPMRACAPL